MRAQLVPLDNGAPLEISKDMTLVGRGEICDLKLDHKSVSKMHCVIVRTDGLLLLRDLGSTNGTRVNGQRIRRAALLPNDQISIASLKFRVLFGAKLLSPVLPDERTQQIDSNDLELLRKGNKTNLEKEEEEEVNEEVVKQNPLPDVYPDHEKE